MSSSALPSHAAPRLAPLARPRGLLQRLFDWAFRHRFGKVMTASRVIYSRMPTLLWRQLGLYHLVEYGLSLPPALRHLIEVQVSMLNGCSFCADLHQAAAAMARVGKDKFAALHDYEHSAAFSAQERAALRYVSEIAEHGRTSDATFEQLRACFGEREIVEITWLQAFTTYLNRMAVPLGIGSDGFSALAETRR